LSTRHSQLERRRTPSPISHNAKERVVILLNKLIELRSAIESSGSTAGPSITLFEGQYNLPAFSLSVLIRIDPLTGYTHRSIHERAIGGSELQCCCLLNRIQALYPLQSYAITREKRENRSTTLYIYR
jgi:hypothetical protein